MYRIIALAAGFVLDCIFGDPTWLYHPICLIGKLIAFLEKKLRAFFPKTKEGELRAGALEVLLVCLICAGVPWLVIYLVGRISAWGAFVQEAAQIRKSHAGDAHRPQIPEGLQAQ